MTSNSVKTPAILDKFETPRLVITAHTLGDFAKFLYDPKRFAERFQLANAPARPDSETRVGLMRRYGASHRLDPARLIWGVLWSVATRENRSFVGAFCFKGPPVAGDAEIAYYIEEPFRNHGYMTETLRAVVEWARKRDDVSGIAAETLLTNVASQRVLLKAGFIPYLDAPEIASDSCWFRFNLDSAPY